MDNARTALHHSEMTLPDGATEGVMGVVRPDPFADRPVDLTVTSQRFLVKGFTEANRGVLPLDALNGTLLHLSFTHDHQHHTDGSAVLVHPGVAITAKHVVEDWARLISLDQASAHCQGVKQNHLLLWDVEALCCAETADLAVLALRFRTDLPADNRLCTNQVTTRMPAVGEQVCLAGFSAEQRTVPLSDIAVGGMVCTATGQVIEVWPTGRDRVMLPSASFAVQCPAIGGMSGGPVFDKDGFLIGIISSSVDGQDIAYVSHVWPALLAPINVVWPTRVTPAPTTLLHMGKKHAVDIHRPDAFSIHADPDHGVVLRYTPWS